jgi:uroporphyrinogen decarboxylase
VQAALRKVRAALPERQALLGFAGAPWTLFAYGMEGKGSKNWTRAKAYLHREPVKARLWLDRLADVSALLLNRHIGAGAQGVQLFDTWAGELDRDDYETFALPAAERTLTQVSGAPRLYFPRGILPACLNRLSCEGLAVSWQVPMQEARQAFPHKVLQGNLDPTALLAGADTACRKARAIVETMKGQAHVFNLGHGLLPETDPDVLGAVIDAVKQ